MSNQDIIPERGAGGKSLLEKWFIPLSLFFLTVSGFGLGRLSQQVSPEPVTILSPAAIQTAARAKESVNTKIEQSGNNFVASQNGKKYYPLSCAGVRRIKEENKIYFKTSAEAESAGYSKAANCSF